MKISYLTIISLISFSAFAKTPRENPTAFVPEGKIVQEHQKEVKIQTTSGTIVEVEFEKDGSFEEASGKSLDKDVLVPGEGLLTLKDSYEAIKKAGKTPVGEWSLEKSMLKGWHYEFEGYENGKKMEYVVDAKSGKLLESKIDD